MRLNFRVKIANLTFFAMIAKTQRLEGVSSLQSDGKHIVMFDLENCSLVQAKKTLGDVQRKYRLSDIFVVSDVEKSYRAWCYSKVDFVTFLKILLDVKFLDWNFFYWTVKRGIKRTYSYSHPRARACLMSVSLSQSVKLSVSLLHFVCHRV